MTDTTPPSRWAHERLLENLWVLGTYWLLAVLVKEYFSRYQMWPAPLWVPAGLAMFAALSMGREIWPGIFLGSFLTNAVTFHEPVIWAALISSGNALGPIVAAERARNRMGIDEIFARVANVFYFNFYGSPAWDHHRKRRDYGHVGQGRVRDRACAG